MGSRDLEQRRERQQFAEDERRRENEQYYRKYAQDCKREQIEPVSFDEWQQAIPEEFRTNENAELRAALANASSNFRRVNKIAVDRLLGSELTDDELSLLGFPPDRVLVPDVEVSVPAVVLAFNQFAAQEPKYCFRAHYHAISEFIVRNKLEPTAANIARVFDILDSLHLLPEPEPEHVPESEPKVNLAIKPDPEIEKQKAWERYVTETVVIDGETGEGWSQYRLDRADSKTFQRLMRLPRLQPIGAPDAHR